LLVCLLLHSCLPEDCSSRRNQGSGSTGVPYTWSYNSSFKNRIGIR
jgi:hypothetical protein